MYQITFFSHILIKQYTDGKLFVLTIPDWEFIGIILNLYTLHLLTILPAQGPIIKDSCGITPDAFTFLCNRQKLISLY